MKELIKPTLVLIIVSLVSFYITRRLIFPAFLISVPLTIYLTQKIYCNYSDASPSLRVALFTLNIYPLVFIASLVLVQIHLPYSSSWYFDADIIHLLPKTGFSVAFFYNLKDILTYPSFVALSLLVYCENGKLKLDNEEFHDMGFLKQVMMILVVNPGILFIFSLFLYWFLQYIFQLIEPLIDSYLFPIW